MALLKMVQVAAAAAMIAGVSVPAHAQQALTVEAVVAGCAAGASTAGPECAALVRAYLANVPVNQRAAVIANLAARLAEIQGAGVSVARGIQAAAEFSPDAGQRTQLANLASTLSADAGGLDIETAASES